MAPEDEEKDHDHRPLLATGYSDASHEESSYPTTGSERLGRGKIVAEWLVRILALASLPLVVLCIILYIKISGSGLCHCESNPDYLFPCRYYLRRAPFVTNCLIP